MIWRRIGRRPGQDVRIMATLFPAAEAAARADGTDSAGAEYLLAAALDLEDGSARRAFHLVNSNPDDFRAAIRASHANALDSIGMGEVNDETLSELLPRPASGKGSVKTAPSARKMFRAVVKKVKEDRSQLYSAYFLLTATETGHGTTISLGIDPAELAVAARSEIDALRAAHD